jgi:AraC-like DNA-binding protein
VRHRRDPARILPTRGEDRLGQERTTVCPETKSHYDLNRWGIIRRQSGSTKGLPMTTAAPSFARLRFSTDDFPERDRAEAWREMLGRAVMKLEIDPLRGSSYQAEMTVHALPDLDIGAGVYSGMQFRRTPALIDSDDLVLVVTLGGARTMHQHGREVALHTGEGALVTCAEPGVAISHAQESFLTFRTPFKAIAPMIADLDGALARRIPQSSGALRLLTGYAELIRKTDALETAELRRLAATHIRDLVVLALGATRDAAAIAGGRGVRAARLNAIKEDIGRHLRDPSLTVNAVAARQRVSPRYVQMLFEPEGTTFSQYVRRRRLLHAHRMLTSSHCAAWTITAIAMEAGFGDLSSFNHAFRHLFGASPSDVRAGPRG